MASIIRRLSDDIGDQGPKIYIVCWLLVGLSAAFLGLRVFCKFKTHRGLWWDDHILIVSWIFLLVSICADSAMVPLGFGKHMSDVDLGNLSAIGLLSNVASTFSILGAVLSKTSFAVTLLRITNGYTKVLIWVIIIVMNVAMGLSALFVWIMCNPPRKTWDRNPAIPGTCWDPYAMMVYSVFAAAISAAMDAALALLPWKVVWTLQMRTQEKIGVALAMSMGIFASATAIIKCTKIPRVYESTDATYVAPDLAIWGAVEIATTIMAACIPVLRVLLRYIKSSAKKYSPHDPSGPSHFTGGARAHTATVTTSRGQVKPQTAIDDDTGSDKSILERSVGVGNQIVHTREFTVQYDNESRGKVNEDSDSMGYEMANRGAPGGPV